MKINHILVTILALMFIIGCSNPMGPGGSLPGGDTGADDIVDNPIPGAVDYVVGVDLGSSGANDPSANWGIDMSNHDISHDFTVTVGNEIFDSILDFNTEAGFTFDDINDWFEAHILSSIDTGYDPVYDEPSSYNDVSEIPIFPKDVVDINDLWDGTNFNLPTGSFTLPDGNGILNIAYIWVFQIHVNVYRLMGYPAYMVLWSDYDGLTTDPEWMSTYLYGANARYGVEVYTSLKKLSPDYDDSNNRDWYTYGIFDRYLRLYNDNFGIIYNDDPNYQDFSQTSMNIDQYHRINNGVGNVNPSLDIRLVPVAKFGSFDEIGVSTVHELGQFMLDKDTYDYVKSIYP